MCFSRKYNKHVPHSFFFSSFHTEVFIQCYMCIDIIYPPLICSGCTFRCTPNLTEKINCRLCLELQQRMMWEIINKKCVFLQISQMIVWNNKALTSKFSNVTGVTKTVSSLLLFLPCVTLFPTLFHQSRVGQQTRWTCTAKPLKTE